MALPRVAPCARLSPSRKARQSIAGPRPTPSVRRAGEDVVGRDRSGYAQRGHRAAHGVEAAWTRHRSISRSRSSILPRPGGGLLPGRHCSTGWSPRPHRQWSLSSPRLATGRRRSWRSGPNARNRGWDGSASTTVTTTPSSSSATSRWHWTASRRSTRGCFVRSPRPAPAPRFRGGWSLRWPGCGARARSSSTTWKWSRIRRASMRSLRWHWDCRWVGSLPSVRGPRCPCQPRACARRAASWRSARMVWPWERQKHARC